MDLRRHATWACAIVIVAAVMPTHGQSRPKATAGSPATWKASRMPDGQPDFQGTWANNTVTPFLRPAALADKPLLTDAELDVLKERAARLFAGDGDLAPGDELFDALLANPKTFVSPRPVGDYNQSWMMEPLAFEYRTSQVVDPSNGRLPALTLEGQRKQAAVDAHRRDHPADGPEDRVPQERCITLGALKVGFVQTRVNSYYEIVQTPRYVLIHNEMMHEARIIPIDGRPHAPSSIRSWMGDSVGHWDGDTFVIDTTNFHPQSVFRPTAAIAISAEHFHVVERLHQLDPNTMEYQVTVTDPTTWTTPFTVLTTWQRSDAQIFEYACHEANYGMEGILRGARAQEKTRTDSPAKQRQ